MPEGGTLTLRTALHENESSPGKVAVEVSDTGVGMDDDTRRRCLEPFFTTKGERGTGLGLAMVYGTLQRHGAEVEIESSPGSGTTMRILFPAATIPEAAEKTEQAPPIFTVPPRMRILIVDDDPVVIHSLRHTLEGDGHIVNAASDGGEGIELFTTSLTNEEPFAVVITDLGMPYVDGRKVAASVKALSPTTPVILLTGWGQRLVIEGDVPPEVNCVLTKPPKLRELRQALAECFQQPVVS
jgi:CheY-like chemotaxis protein